MKLPDAIMDDPGVVGVAARRMVAIARIACGHTVMYRCALTTLGPAHITSMNGPGGSVAVTESVVVMKPIHAGSLGEIQREISGSDLVYNDEDLN